MTLGQPQRLRRRVGACPRCRLRVKRPKPTGLAGETIEKKTFHLIAVLFGIAASLLAIAAVAVYEGYLPESTVDNLTSGELGVLAALSVAAAVGFAEIGERA